jgi:hypothetical protein
MPGGTSGDEAIKHVGKRRVRIAGRFFPNGSSAIDNTTNQGKKGWSVAYVSTGLYRLTIQRRWLKLVPLGLGLQLASAAARKLQWGAFTANDSAGTWTCDIRCVDGSGTVQDIAANANNSIGFELEAVQDTVAG